MNESRESKNAEQLEELLLLTEEIQEELEQKDQLIVELKTQLSESLTLNEKLNKENRAGNIQALKNDLKLADRALRIEKEKLRSANVMIEECQDTGGLDKVRRGWRGNPARPPLPGAGKCYRAALRRVHYARYI